MGAIAASLALALLVPGSTTSARATSRPARLAGTFIQLSRDHLEWSEDQWTDLFAQFDRLCLSQIVVQWAQYGTQRFDVSTASGASAPLSTILRLADAARMRVLVGLYQDPAYWERVARAPDLVEVYLKRLRLQSTDLATSLMPLVGGHPSFDGWYVSEEIDDLNWRSPGAQAVLFGHLGRLVARLRRIAPGRRIAVSGFASARTAPSSVGRFWVDLLEKASIDVVMFQDGIGVDKLELDYLPLYLAAMKNAVVGQGRDLQVIVELFRQTAGSPIDDGDFRAVAGSADRVLRQIAVADTYSTAGVMAFAVPDYMTTSRGVEASRLLEDYVDALRVP